MMLPSLPLALLIVVAVFSPLLAAPCILGSLAVTQGQRRGVVVAWYAALAVLVSAPIGAAVLAVILGGV